MSLFITELRQTIAPRRGSDDGPLPPMMLALTVVTGLVDAFSYLALGHVFVANMTGNVVFLGFALAGAPGFSVTASVMAVGFFAVGAFAGGSFGSRWGADRSRLLSVSTTVQVVLILAAGVLALLAPDPIANVYRVPLIGLLAGAMGLQNSIARRIAVPDLSTTVLTLTITGVASDSRLAGGTGSRGGRRGVAIGAMLLGAYVGAMLVVHGQLGVPLLLASGVVLVVATSSWAMGRARPSWTHPRS